MMPSLLHPRILQELRELLPRMEANGELPSRAQLDHWAANFRARFGPEVLAALDGEPLLELMHAHGSHDSLVYWLEFKDDDEFGAHFGSVAGGSALKFGLYRNKETGAWMTGAPQNQRVLTVPEAVDMARNHRNQLVRGCELLSRVPTFKAGTELAAVDAAYRELQTALDAEAPNVSNSAWAHKYFSLLFRDRLDDYHNPDWHRFHQLRLLLMPTPAGPRYLPAGRFTVLADELGVPVNHLTDALNKHHGSPRGWWRVGTTDDASTPRKCWPDMRDGQFIAIGWPELGDLGQLEHSREAKEKLREQMQAHYPGTPQFVGRQVQQVFNFLHWMEPGSRVVAADGARILGIGEVTGGYRHEPGAPMPHRLPVRWLDTGEWKMSTGEGLMRSVMFFQKPESILEIERRLLDPQATKPVEPVKPGPVPAGPKPQPLPPLEPMTARIHDVLERKGQVVLYGPPGTGKTFHAERAARELAARELFKRGYDSLDDAQRKQVLGDGTTPGAVRVCCFHPAYGYEDFLEGYRPVRAGDGTAFELRDGIFKRLCQDAARVKERLYLVIDEVNRGDIPRIFGELMMVLEKSKRGRAITLPLSGAPFSVPANVCILATMNTADRSIALLDTALRRRFGFLELMPEPQQLGTTVIKDIPLGPWLVALNRRICQHVGRNARNLQVGHAYLLEDGKPITSMRRLARVLCEDLVPLLEEYCYEDYEALARILGAGLVDAAAQRVKSEVFEPGHEEALRKALLQPCPEIVTAALLVSAASDEDAEGPAEEELVEAVG